MLFIAINEWTTVNWLWYGPPALFLLVVVFTLATRDYRHEKLRQKLGENRPD
jgi:hypothetical protein